MNLPNEIKEFLLKKVEFENYCLPHFYPEPDAFDEFQIGYKIDGVSNKDITGENNGDFSKNWYVICTAYAADPFFIDITEEDNIYPVYFAWHGGDWKPIRIANSIEEFTNILMQLKGLEENRDTLLDELEKHFDIKDEFWSEVYSSYQEEESVSEYEPTSQKVKRIYEINRELKTLQEAKQKGTIQLKEYILQKRRLENEIITLNTNV